MTTPFGTVLCTSITIFATDSCVTQCMFYTQDPSALDFDLALDERMFEHEAPQKPHSSNDRAERECSNQKTAIRGKWVS